MGIGLLVSNTLEILFVLLDLKFIPTSLKEGKLPCASLEKINFPFTVTSNEAVVKDNNVELLTLIPLNTLQDLNF